MRHSRSLLIAAGLLSPWVAGATDLSAHHSMASASMLWGAAHATGISRPAWADTLYISALKKATQNRSETIPDSIPYDQRNTDIYGAKALALVTAFRTQGDTSSRDQAEKILLGLAKSFDAKSDYITSNYGLDFSVNLPAFAYVFSVVQPSMAEKDRRLIVDHWFLPAAQRIQQTAYGAPSAHPGDDFRRQKSNIRAWQNAAVGAVGFTIGGAQGDALAEWAVSEPHGGFYFQMEYSILPDGVVGEGSWAYHMYSLLPWTILALAADHGGQSLMTAKGSTEASPLKKAFQTAVQSANADLTLPSWGDGRETHLKEYGSLFSVANALSPDPSFQRVISQSTTPAGYRSETALLDALAPFLNTVQAPAALADHSLFLPEAGIAILKSSPLYLVFESGSPRSHSNASRNTIVAIYSDNQLLSGHQTNGSKDYADHDLNGYRRGLAYNTLLVDDAPAKSALNPGTLGAHGRLSYWDAGPSVQAVEGQTEDSFDGAAVQYNRFVELIAGTQAYVVDFVRATGAASRKFTLVVHGPDNTAPSLKGQSWTAGGTVDAPVYKRLTEWQMSALLTGSQTMTWTGTGTSGLTVTVLGDAQTQTQYRAASAPGVDRSTGSLVLAERQAPVATFISVYEPLGSQAPWTATPLIVTPDAGAGVRLSGPSVDWHVAVFGDPAEVRATNPAEAQDYLVCRGKRADLRISGTTVQASGQVAAFRVKAPGAQTVTLNGQPARSTTQGDFIEVTHTPFTSGLLHPDKWMAPAPLPEKDAPSPTDRMRG